MYDPFVQANYNFLLLKTKKKKILRTVYISFQKKKKNVALVLDDPVLAIRSAAFSEKPFRSRSPLRSPGPTFPSVRHRK